MKACSCGQTFRNYYALKIHKYETKHPSKPRAYGRVNEADRRKLQKLAREWDAHVVRQR